ncbi:ATP-binding protein [Nonomuraea sp. NPDC050310]|uniref:ATP-binding protein n=1 Tax=Nonomuraea sp. NPDC050310 TaxID=3154935 RepID=UPI0033F53E19
MKKTFALGLAAAAVASMTLATSPSATAASSPTVQVEPSPLPDGVTTITDQILAADRTLRGPGLRSRYNLFVVGLHGSATVRDKGTAFIGYTWQRGTLTAKTDTSVTVTSKDGFVQTWTLHPATRVRRDAKQADLGRAFDRFHEDGSDGTGLGLAIVKAITEAHGGQCRIVSPPGTTVYVELPAESSRPPHPAFSSG